ncbi:MAG: haloacid dehalogenase type II [Thermoleophilia bacterium]|nr:haloacid dehalogenase type II [Thermoleophilia bacterium]
MSRWATFDCYGTLIDWNAGIGGVLERLFGVEQAPRLLERYHELEPEVAAEEYRPYAAVLTLTLERLAQEVGYGFPEGESGALAKSLPDWPPFPDVPEALEELRRRGWQLAILSNTDRDLIAASERRIGVPFDLTVVAEDVGSYKPATGHWQRFFELTTADRDRHVHVAASLFHDIAPAAELGLTSVWINRLGEPTDDRPARELPDLAGLPDALDDLVEP